jgi:cytochrome c553
MNALKNKRCRAAACLLMFAFCFANASPPDPDDGRRMYRDGVMPTGEPLTAIVAGDVPILGTQFSCQSCHGQSGMGAAEGTYIVPPVAGQFLFSESPQPARPAYDVQSLARLLRDGVTPGGRQLDVVMPRYRLDDTDVADLAAYLRDLSSGWSPGVDDTVIRFATVVTDEVSTEERDAVMAVLNTFVEEKNRQTRLESERWDRGYTPASRLPTVHRDWVLEEWQLSGAPDTWGAQLETHYRANPVFAMLSGIGDGVWGPVSRFCERNEIPCLFPGVNVTDAQPDDFYTLYYSRGLELEADLVASHLREQPVTNLVQIYCTEASQQAALRLQEGLDGTQVGVRHLRYSCDEALLADTISELVTSAGESAIVLWMTQDGVAAFPEKISSGRFYVSSILLDGAFGEAVASLPGPVFAAHTFRLPGQFDPAFARFNVWAKTREVELTSPRRQSEAFFACLAMKDAIAHMGRFFIRDYALDTLDHAQSIVAYLSYYPRPTLGPRQRFVNKGGYVLELVDGEPQSQAAEWIVP